MSNAPSDERAVASSDYDSTYDSTYETNHSDSSDFAQNEEEGEAGKRPQDARHHCKEYLERGVVLHPLLLSPEVRNPLQPGFSSAFEGDERHRALDQSVSAYLRVYEELKQLSLWLCAQLTG